MEINIRDRIIEIKKPIEASIVGAMYKNPDMFHEYELALDDFSNVAWRTFYHVGSQIAKSGKNIIDENVVEIFLMDKQALSNVYESNGGWSTLELLLDNVHEENLQGYVNDLYKYNILEQMQMAGFNIEKNFDKLKSMSANEIYELYETLLNNLYTKSGNDKIEVVSIVDGLDEMIEECDSGQMIGLPFYNAPILTNETCGLTTPTFSLISGISGGGKTAFVFSSIIPSIIDHKEKLLVINNEEGLKKWQQDLLIWWINNRLGKDMTKSRLKRGKFTDEEKQIIYQARDEIKQLIDRKSILLCPMEQGFTTGRSLKTIKKYANLGVKHFLIDTLKEDTDSEANENTVLQLKLNAIKIFNITRQKDLHVMATYQLTKNSAVSFYLTQANLGNSKNILDVAGLSLMIRSVFDSEKEGGRSPLKMFRYEGRTKIPLSNLNESENYIVVFLDKNRNGSSKNFQIVYSIDFGRMLIKEVGCTIIPFSA